MRRPLPALVLATVALLSMATVLSCGSFAGDDSSDEIRIEGLSAEDVKEVGISLKVPVDEPTFDAIHAAEVALLKYPAAKIRQVVLVHRYGGGLTWVVNFEPDSLEPVPPFGYAGPIETKADGQPDYGEIKYGLIFVNARTGEYAGGLTANRGWSPPD